MPVVVAAQTAPEPPEYFECYLGSVYPAGGRQGTAVTVEIRAYDKSFKGKQLQGLRGARGIVVDGPPGITAGKVTNVSDTVVRAELTIAADAVPGRRMLRVLNERTGLTNFCYFLVGTLPEIVEAEKNDDLVRAQDVPLPVVANGRIGAAIDVDCFRFSARKGRRLVCAVTAHAIDSRSNAPRSFADASLEVLDDEGRVVADASDTLGLDPLVEFIPPADGRYVARVRLVNYRGFPDAVYRLTIGEAPFPTALFPVALQQGTSGKITFSGVNVPAGTESTVVAPKQPGLPVQYLVAPGGGTYDLPLLMTELPERAEREPNDDRAAAERVAAPCGISGRFVRSGDEDWYRIALKKGNRLRCEIHAQRLLRSPVDTSLEIFDAAGKSLAANDDLQPTDVERIHDFDPFDSLLTFAAPADGEYLIRVAEQTGTAGDRAVYHLSIDEARPDLRLHAWPDAAPIWGPGSTACFCVTLDRVECDGEVELRIEGLPPGWIGSTSIAPGGSVPTRRAFMTVTAPTTAKPGDVVEFRVVGRTKVGDRIVERVAQPLTDYMPDDDRELCRFSPKQRAIVARDLGIRLTTDVRELKVAQGRPAEVAVRVSPAPKDLMPISVNLAGNSVRASLGGQQKLPVADGVVRVPIACENLTPGRYAIVVALAWGNETRQGMPGPCTSVILLDVVPPGNVAASR